MYPDEFAPETDPHEEILKRIEVLIKDGNDKLQEAQRLADEHNITISLYLNPNGEKLKNSRRYEEVVTTSTDYWNASGGARC